MRNKIQKIFYISSQEKADLLEGFLSDESDITGKSATVLMEDRLFNSFVPNSKYLPLAEELFVKKDSETIRNTVEYLLNTLAIQSDSELGKQLVKFMYENMNLSIESKVTAEQRDIDNLRTKLRDLSNTLARLGNKKDGDDLALVCDDSTFDSVSLQRVYVILFNNWDKLSALSETYRLLVSMAHVQEFNATVEGRMELLKMFYKLPE